MEKKLSAATKKEYATKLSLISLFLSIFGVFVSRLSVWRKDEKEFSLKPLDLFMLGFATLRLGRMIAYDRVAEPLRQPFAETVPDHTGAGKTVEPRGEGVRNSLGQLISCPICVGTWIASGLVYGLHMLPNPTRVFLTIMSTMGVTELLNALTETFEWTGQLARTITGYYERHKLQPDQELNHLDSDESIDHLFNPGGKYYVRTDHEKYYREGKR
jgi:hypothetical protein